ncbi:MAG: acyltransferase [Opitutaceae bacterium]
MSHALQPYSPPAPRLWTLDALRGACALIVFLNHWHLWSNFAPDGRWQHAVRRGGDLLYALLHEVSWPPGGHHPAVICFFVLSGFCIHYPYENRARAAFAGFDWPDYFRRRFWRIMPVYWTASLLGLALIAVEMARPSGSQLLQLHTEATTAGVAVRFAGLAGIYPREIFAGNYILNTVAVEMLMYALYPLFIRFASRGAWRTLGCIFSLGYLSTLLLVEVATPYWVFNSVFMLGIFWFLGAYAAHVFVVSQSCIRGLWPALAWITFTGLKFIPYFHGRNLVIQLCWGLVCALGILWLLGRERANLVKTSAGTKSVLQYFSRISYALYAVHTPVLMLATWSLLVTTHRQNYPLQLITGFLASAAATLAVYYGVERVFYRPRN